MSGLYSLLTNSLTYILLYQIMINHTIINIEANIVVLDKLNCNKINLYNYYISFQLISSLII